MSDTFIGTSVLRIGDGLPGLSSRRSLLCLGILAAMMGGTTNSYALEKQRTAALEEVTVTATRREASLQDVATSITAVTGADLEARGVTLFADVQKIAAGVYLEQIGSMINTSVHIRGVGTSGPTALDQSVGIVVDGLYQLRQGSAFTEMLDVERVEVMRGPQGTLFGKNTTAGVIAISTANPDLDALSGKVQGVAGNMDALEMRGVVNVPLVSDTLAVRLGAYDARRDGYTDNDYLGEDTRNVDRHGYRGKLLWRPVDNFDVLFSAEQQEQNKDDDQATVKYAPGTGAGLPPVSLGHAQQQHDETEEKVDRYILTLSWDVGNHTLKSLTGYEDIHSFSLQDRDGTILPAQQLISYNDTEVTTEELQLLSAAEGPLQYVLGAFYQKEELVSDNYFSVNGGDPFRVNLTERKQESKAGYLNVSYSLTDRLGFSAGTRYTDDEKIGPSDGVEYKKNFEEWTWSTKLYYDLDDDKMAYLAWDRGFKSGGINRTTVRGAFDTFWEPEWADNYELGLKSEWLDNRLRLNAALFYTKFDDYQVTTVLPDLAAAAITNAAKVESKGIEADVMAFLTDNLSVSGSIAYIQTEYEKYESAPCDRFDPQPGCAADGTIDLSGEKLDHAPEWTVNLGAEYRAALGEGMDWFVRGDIAYRDDMNLSTNLHPVGELDAYTLLNARAGVETADGHWKVTVWGNNLADKEYIVAASINSFGNWSQMLGLTRTYGVTVDWSF